MTTDAMVPSYRVQRESDGVSWRMLAVAGGLLTAVAVGAGGWWAFQNFGGPRAVPLVEADPRPFKVRPDDPGGLRVPNQAELIMQRPAGRAQAAAQAGTAALAPEAEAPNLDRLRAAVLPPPPPVVAPRAAEPAQTAPPAQAAAPASPAPAPAAAQAAAPPRPAAGRVVVQLGALSSEEAARAEWARLNRLVPELLDGKSPQILRFEREGRAPLFRLRTGGLPDQDAASEFCEQVKARRGNCVPVRS
jgi:hypothetical protein